MEKVDIAKRKLIQASTAIGASAMLGFSLKTQASASTHYTSFSDYENWDITAMADLLRQGDVSPLELTDKAIEKFEANSDLNMVAVEHFEMARNKAKSLNQLSRSARRQKMSNSPLLGVPFALKDLGVGLAGTITTNGSQFFKDNVVTENSTLVTRYQKAGLNIMAKLTSPEFGQTPTGESTLHGNTLNPWDKRYSSGGSSAGSAVAVAARVLPAAHASDGGGSIRIPAAHCGLFGLKPSRGRVATGPTSLESSMGLSVHHALTRSVRDSAMLLQLTQGKEPGSRITLPNEDMLGALHTKPRALKIALMDTHPFGYPVEQDIKDALTKTVKLLEGLGHHVELAKPDLPLQEMFGGMGVATSSSLLKHVQSREKALGRAAREDEFEALVWGHLQKAKSFTAQQMLAARTGFDKGAQVLDAFFNDYDYIVSPVTTAAPPKIGELTLNQPYDDFVKVVLKSSPICALFNITGLPAMSVPLHWNKAGLPIGVQFAGSFGNEAGLISLASQLERAAPWADKRPTAIA
ncbi:amidase [Aliiglaciecola lipolytica]|uniref:Twin-arginine translocation pathway signal n=1 Tax=Aliiglaciecola lipolytica E3 TaxID=1127673 RepID=K6YBG5_9ALTE|nr:amidase [Aliiglaciecola lipolytica]GAC13983.1 twin-arginine translocation pathway signal [Aliiglaciecola lipolytica E3]